MIGFTTGQMFFFFGIGGIVVTLIATAITVICLRKEGKRLHKEIWEEYWREPGRG